MFKRKTPDHRGLNLTGDAQLELGEGDLVIEREDDRLSMKIQAKDCAQGGIFQMEPEREDNTTTRNTHVLATSQDPRLTAFYFDNPNFRAREGDVVPFKDTTVTVTPRVNFANDFSPKFVGRDSPQVATRVLQGCPNTIARRDGTGRRRLRTGLTRRGLRTGLKDLRMDRMETWIVVRSQASFSV